MNFNDPVGLGKLNLKAMKAPKDRNWWLNKKKPSQFADNKNAPGKPMPVTLLAESIEDFVDKHAIELLEKIGVKTNVPS